MTPLLSVKNTVPNTEAESVLDNRSPQGPFKTWGLLDEKMGKKRNVFIFPNIYNGNITYLLLNRLIRFIKKM